MGSLLIILLNVSVVPGSALGKTLIISLDLYFYIYSISD
jgi:hypothetical protein